MPLSPSHRMLIGGAVCLDFINSRNRSASEGPFDFFSDYPALLSWGLQLGLLSQSDAENQMEKARRQKRKSRIALERAIELREDIFSVFSAIAGKKKVPDRALKNINLAWASAMDHLQILPDQERFTWKWKGMADTLDGLLWPVAQSAAELLVSEKITRIKRCSGCGWLFVDSTRDVRRRWCDMKICGNRAKAKRFRERKRLSEKVPHS
jgi:predicted RNA-binding Zn ribbon-like protein